MYHLERKHCVLKLPPIKSQNNKLIEVLIGPKDNYEILWTTNMEEGAQKEKRRGQSAVLSPRRGSVSGSLTRRGRNATKRQQR